MDTEASHPPSEASVLIAAKKVVRAARNKRKRKNAKRKKAEAAAKKLEEEKLFQSLVELPPGEYVLQNGSASPINVKKVVITAVAPKKLAVPIHHQLLPLIDSASPKILREILMGACQANTKTTSFVEDSFGIIPRALYFRKIECGSSDCSEDGSKYDEDTISSYPVCKRFILGYRGDELYEDDRLSWYLSKHVKSCTDVLYSLPPITHSTAAKKEEDHMHSICKKYNEKLQCPTGPYRDHEKHYS